MNNNDLTPITQHYSIRSSLYAIEKLRYVVCLV